MNTLIYFSRKNDHLFSVESQISVEMSLAEMTMLIHVRNCIAENLIVFAIFQEYCRNITK